MNARCGTTRLVILTRRYAFKLPSIKSWRLFLMGLLGNIQERQFGTIGWDGLCPVLFSIPGGWLVVMPRCRAITANQWDNLDFNKFVDREDYVLPVECKQDSFGWLNGKVVAYDYGS
ncbi:hypothetical protein [Sinorhizobium sp. BJ1]|uniref:hypothetical protein n=1 Tax=Sinorhizobium sp. BJ1 TaxID=2035455 RepID=UPI000BE9EFEA|nr:hypothetical protein [Sinorhizobium sp. BJ1]PDT86527.1 hypothetical protein CO676_02230 [Sinorhizobium sp. BJ1]